MGAREICCWNTETWTRLIAYIGLGGYPIWLLCIALELTEVVAGRRAKTLARQGYDVDLDVTLFIITSALAIIFCVCGIVFSAILLAAVKSKHIGQLTLWTRWAIAGIIFSFIYFIIGSINGNSAVISVHVIYTIINLFFLLIVRVHIEDLATNYVSKGNDASEEFWVYVNSEQGNYK